MGNAAAESSAATATAATPITNPTTLHAVVIRHTSASDRRAWAQRYRTSDRAARGGELQHQPELRNRRDKLSDGR